MPISVCATRVNDASMMLAAHLCRQAAAGAHASAIISFLKTRAMAGVAHRMRRNQRRWRAADPDGYAEWVERHRRHVRSWWRRLWHRLNWRLGFTPGVRLIPSGDAYRLEVAGRIPSLDGAWKMSAHDPCVYCGDYCGAKMQSLDHIVPRSHGGSNRWDNLAPSCRSCNHAKANMTLLWYLCTVARERARKREQFNTRKTSLRYSLGTKLSAALVKQ